MSTFNAFYIRKKAADKQTCSAILSLYPKAHVRSFDNFIGGVLSSDEWGAPEKKLSALSAKLKTDILWVSFQTTAGSFIYHHWQNGTNLRTLMYGCLKAFKWDRVEGQAEPWEQGQFWDKKSLKMCLKEERSEKKKKKLQKIWSDGVLIRGSEFPIAGDDTAVHAIMGYYGFGY